MCCAGGGGDGVGTKLYVSQPTTGTDYLSKWVNKMSSPQFMLLVVPNSTPDNDTQRFISATDASALRYYVTVAGNNYNHDGTYGTISDIRCKQDIVNMRSYWDDFKSLLYRKYRHKTDVVDQGESAPYRVGLIAQEVETIFPGLVASTPDEEQRGGKTVPSGTETMSVKSTIIEGPIMATVVQELQARVEALEAA